MQKEVAYIVFILIAWRDDTKALIGCIWMESDIEFILGVESFSERI